jgi:hypothetical protein
MGTVEQPFKTPRNGELTFAQKLFNKLFAASRVVIANANSEVRLLSIEDEIRIHSAEFRDNLTWLPFRLRNSSRVYTSCALISMFINKEYLI